MNRAVGMHRPAAWPLVKPDLRPDSAALRTPEPSHPPRLSQRPQQAGSPTAGAMRAWCTSHRQHGRSFGKERPRGRNRLGTAGSGQNRQRKRWVGGQPPRRQLAVGSGRYRTGAGRGSSSTASGNQSTQQPVIVAPISRFINPKRRLQRISVRHPSPPVNGHTKPKKRAGLSGMPANTIQTGWKQDIPVLVRAMVLAGETLFLAGPADLIDEHKTLAAFDTPATQELLARQAAVLEGSEGASLWAVSTSGGKKLAEQKLDSLPVFDGMVAAGDRIYYATTDGRVIALGGKPR